MCPIGITGHSLKLLETTDLLSISKKMPLLDISSKQDHINVVICIPLHLASVALHNVFKGHPFCTMNQYFILFNSWTIFHSTDRPCFIYSFIHWWTFGLLLWLAIWITLLWIFMYKFLCGCMFPLSGHIQLGVEFLDLIVTLYLTSQGNDRLYFRATAPFSIYTSNIWVFKSLHILTNTCFYVFFITAILVDVK